MAEETPGNLNSSGFFGGHATNTGGARADRTASRLDATVNRLADVLSRASQNFGAGRAAGGHGAPTGTHQANPNGGGATFSGAPTQTGGHAASGTHRATAAQRAGTMYQNAGGTNGVARKAGTLGVAGLTAYTAMNASDEYVMQSLAAQYSPYGDVTRTARHMFGGNVTAANARDAQQAQLMMRTTSGFTPGSAGYANARRVTEGMSYVDPTISNTASMAAANSLGSVSSFNKLQGLGITATDSKGQADPMSIARQIVAKIGGSRVKTIEQVDAAFGPSGGATVTLEGYIANGYLSPEAAGSVRAAMRAILMAQVRGMSYTQLQKDVKMAQGGGQFFGTNDAERARERLKDIGVGNSLIQGEREREGGKRDSQLETLGGFTKGVELGQNTMKQLRDIFNTGLRAPGVGEVLGFLSGGQAGGMSGLVSSLNPMKILNPGGDGPRNMAAGAASYGGAARAGAGSGGSFGHGGGSHIPRGGVVGSTGSATRAGEYSLGSVKSWVSRAASILGPKFGIRSIGGYRSTSSTPGSDHPKGLALDFMCSTSQGDQLAPYAVANHKALNITYVIWRQRIWSINSPGWKAMEDRGSPTANHMDHVHISFLASPSNPNVGGTDLGSGGATSGAGGGFGLGGSASPMDNGSSAAFTSSTPTASLGSNIGYSEMAALALGGSGGGLGGGGMSAGGSSASGTSGGIGGGASSSGIGGSVGSQAGGSVRTGTYNLFRKSNNKDSQDDLTRLMRMADVLSLTEYIGAKRKLGPWFESQGWGISAPGGSDDTAIAWDKSDYDLISGGARSISDSGGKGAFRDRKAAFARLRNKATGAEFYQVSGHTVGHAQRGNSGWESKMREQYAGIADLVGDLKDSNIPILLAGDFNVNSKRTSINPNFGLEHLAGIGLDRIYGSGVSGSNGTKRVTGLSSDHDAILSTIGLNAVGGGQGGKGGSPSANQALGRAMAAKYGWGNQWGSLLSLWNHESGWRHTADNPSSSAYGIPQALAALHNLPKGYYDKSTGSGSGWQGYGGDPGTQIKWGLDYIKGRYGGPDAAWDFWQKNNWYDRGSWSVRADQDARVHQGEMIIPEKVADGVRQALTGFNRGSGGSGGVTLAFGKESIKIEVNGDSTRKAGVQMAESFVEAVYADQRIRALAEGRS